LWKQTLPAGHSSPAVWGARIFPTGFDNESKKLELICLARNDGAILWRRVVLAQEIEKTQTVSNPATGTPAADRDTRSGWTNDKLADVGASLGLRGEKVARQPALRSWNSRRDPYRRGPKDRCAVLLRSQPISAKRVIA
jgi:hypothetical protein